MSGHDFTRVDCTNSVARPEPKAAGIGVGSFAAALALGGSVRLWIVVGQAPSWWQDSTDYATSAGAGLLSADLWFGDRPPIMPLLLGLAGGEPGHRFIIVQAVIAAMSWAWLAAEVASSMRSRRRSAVAASVIVGFSLADPILMWDRQVLTESLTLALLAAVCAATLRFARSQRAAAGLLVVATCAVWGLTRDATAAALVAAGLVAAVAGRCDGAVIAVAVGVTMIGLLAGVAGTAAHRHRTPMSHVYFARVLPYPERVAWFEAHGMPNAAEFDARSVAEPRPGEAKVIAFAEDDPVFASWWRWFDRHGAETWRAYVVAHPWYLVSEPVREPERGYNNAEGSVAFYRPAGLPHVPMTTSLLWPSMTASLMGLGLTAFGVWRSNLRGPHLLLAGLLCVGAAAYASIAWHTDAMESARHVFIAGAMARLALLIASVGIVDAGIGLVTPGAEADLEPPRARFAARKQ